MSGNYFLIDKRVLPEVYEKVVNAKKLLREGKVKEVTEAASYKAEAETVKLVPVEQYGFQADEISTSWFVTEGIIP